MALYTYPSNKLEYLVEVLSKLLDYEQKDIFAPTQLIVGSRGMQHWLSMQLAETRSITMNQKYEMINGYIINLCYDLVGKQDLKKAYTREPLTWRVYNLLDKLNYDKLAKYYSESNLKKYQLSEKIAEIFSKYISYRADWLEAWQRGEYIDQNNIQEDEQWQQQLWQLLTLEINDTPYKVLSEAKSKLSVQSLVEHNIPKDIYIFGVNTISPKNLDFIYHLAKFVNIHVLYINPCSEYWYDLKKDKISAWLGNDDFEIQPLLANLGQQGKEFFNELLDNQEKQEFNVFEDGKSSLDFQKLELFDQSQLVSLQRNLLELNCQNYSKSQDQSISINSCHSPLREVQILHDKLLDIIKLEQDIRPRDILVMCPNIEDYAPYIDSVFSKYAHENRLPCSVADRTLLDSEPVVASFIDLLQLPESNFEVNKILDYLSVPAIQKKFDISQEQLETIHYWLKETSIHHSNNDQIFSWSWGLRRLMLGFGYSDQQEILDDKLLTVPIIEDNKIIELGGLYELLELLSEYTEELMQLRTLKEWQSYLLDMLESVFKVDNNEQYIFNKIKDIVAKLVDTASDIVEDELVDLYTVRYCLISQLSEPIINNHFLNGKVTFCSMTPMRNVPFKVVAMLGLNSGKFPRQDQAISFDLMARKGRRSGDRTKRDDDRYLFLESILSARKYLYLSYIGRSVKTNVKQEPSLILKELISYLQMSYNWSEHDIKEYPLHAFSQKCYSTEYLSYDKSWYQLIQKQPSSFYDTEELSKQSADTISSYQMEMDMGISENKRFKLPQNLSISELVKMFDNPLKAYAKSLELVLDDFSYELDDSEPFDVDPLVKHDFKQQLVSNFFNENLSIPSIKKVNKLSGKFPESYLTEEVLEDEYIKISKLISDSGVSDSQKLYFEYQFDQCALFTHAYLDDSKLKLFTTSNFSIKHKFELYLSCLLASVCDESISKASYFYLEKDGVKEFEIDMIDRSKAKGLLNNYISQADQILARPRLAHLKLAEVLFSKQKSLNWDKVISDSHNYQSLDKDSYFNLFYPESISPEKFESEEMYKDFFDTLNLEL